MSVVNFVQELESDQISVNLLPGYIPGKTIAKNNWRDYPSGTLRDRSPVLQPQSKINKEMQTSQKPQHLELYN